MIAAALALGATIDPDTLYAAVRQARTTASYARYATYATVVRFRRGEHAVSSTWESFEDLRRRLVYARAIRREDGPRPNVPRGIDLVLRATVAMPVVVPPGAMMAAGAGPTIAHTLNPDFGPDPIGPVTLAVDQDFGLALDAPPIAATGSLGSLAATDTTLAQIGRTGAIARTYQITDLGDVAESGQSLHHLGLRPLREPARYRLRELWSDATTGVPVRAVVAGIGKSGPLTTVLWQVDFVQVEGGTYVQRETALAPVTIHGVRLDGVTVSFEELHAVNRLRPEQQLGLSGEPGITDP